MSKYVSKNSIIIVGAGGHAKAVIDAVDNKKDIYGVLDKDAAKKGALICGVEIVDCDDNADVF